MARSDRLRVVYCFRGNYIRKPVFLIDKIYLYLLAGYLVLRFNDLSLVSGVRKVEPENTPVFSGRAQSSAVSLLKRVFRSSAYPVGTAQDCFHPE